MIKIPNISSKHILEVKRKFNMGIRYYILKKEYNISYNDIRKITTIFTDCEFEDDIDSKIDELKQDRELKRIKKYKDNYQRNRSYFLKYSKQVYAKKIEITI